MRYKWQQVSLAILIFVVGEIILGYLLYKSYNQYTSWAEKPITAGKDVIIYSFAILLLPFIIVFGMYASNKTK